MGRIVRWVLARSCRQPRYDRVVPAPLVPIAALVGFVVVTVAVTWLNLGSPVDFGGLFPAQGRRDWPRGVQEGDVPRFAVDHAEGLRPARPADGLSIQELADPRPIPRIEPVVVRPVHRLTLKH
jgi:hypothetical protein